PPPPPPAISTLSLPDALPILAYPTAPAFYPVPVRPLRSLPPASSPPRLTATQLPLASDSGRHGSQRTSTSNISAMPGAPHQIGSLREPDLARSALGLWPFISLSTAEPPPTRVSLVLTEGSSMTSRRSGSQCLRGWRLVTHRRLSSAPLVLLCLANLFL